MVFDQSKYLPSWAEAQKHAQASKVGFYDEESKDICHCCHQKTQKEPIPLCENTKSLEFLGFGFPLFYMFIRNCLILLILLIISNNFISLIISIKDGTEYCNAHPPVAHSPETAPHHFMASREHFEAEDPNLYLSRKCGNLFLMIARTDKVPNIYENVLRICSFVIHVLALLYIKDKIIKTWAYYDERQSDLSDYTVIIKNIPVGLGVRGKLEQFISKETVDKDNNRFQVNEIILIPGIEEVEEAHNKYEQSLQHYLHARHQKEPNLEHHIKNLEHAQSHKFAIVEQTIGKINKDQIDSNNAIVVFQTEAQKEYFLSQADNYQESGKLDKYFPRGQSQIIIEEAPEPREIIYQNLQYSKDRLKNMFIGWGLSLLFLLVITVVFYFIQLVKTSNLDAALQEEEQHPDSSSAATRKTIAKIIAWVTLIGIVFFNKFVMGNVLHYFTHLQKHDNKAFEDFSFAFKYALGMFFTTALMTIAVEAIKFKNFYQHDFGVIDEETIMFILCAFLVPLIWTIHPLQLCHEHAREKHKGHLDVTQHEANHLMADYHYDMGKRYAELIQMMWFTFLYADLIPIGAFLIFIGFCIYYWVDKYNLLNRSSLEGNISADLAVKCLFLLDFTLFWRFLGELIFDIQIRDGAKTLTLVFLGLSILYMLVPWESFLQLVNSEEFKLNDKKFSDEKHRFEDDNYKIYHPVYSEFITKEHERGGEFQMNVNDMFLHGQDLHRQQKKQQQPNILPNSGFNSFLPNLNPNANPNPNPNPNLAPYVPYVPYVPPVNPNSSINPSSSMRPSVKITYK